jgi:hypothetical protein
LDIKYIEHILEKWPNPAIDSVSLSMTPLVICFVICFSTDGHSSVMHTSSVVVAAAALVCLVCCSAALHVDTNGARRSAEAAAVNKRSVYRFHPVCELWRVLCLLLQYFCIFNVFLLLPSCSFPLAIIMYLHP